MKVEKTNIGTEIIYFMEDLHTYKRDKGNAPGQP